MNAARMLAALVGVQLALVALYLAVEGWRPTPTPFAVETLDAPAPPLTVVRGGGDSAPAPAAQGSQTHLVHFWATWCGPCKEELPGLLEATRAQGVPLVAVTDEPWPVVQRYFEPSVPDSIVRDPSGTAAAAWRVSGLPDTFVVRDGRVLGRMGGPRDWTSPEARDFLSQLRRSP